jgi:hypothetical protein
VAVRETGNTAIEYIHLHSRAGTVCRREHVRVIAAAKILRLGPYRITSQTSSPVVVRLRIAVFFFEAEVVIPIVKEIDGKK